MKHFTIEITVDGDKRYEVWQGSTPAEAKYKVCDALNMAYGSGNGRWLVGRATASTEAEIDMDRRLSEMLIPA